MSHFCYVKEGEEFAILTNLIHREWSGISVQEHKNVKVRDLRPILRLS